MNSSHCTEKPLGGSALGMEPAGHATSPWHAPRAAAHLRRRAAIVFLLALAVLWQGAARSQMLGTAGTSLLEQRQKSQSGAISGYTLGGAIGTQTLVVPYFSMASLISIRNLSNAPTTLTIEYRDLAGIDETPAQNTYVLAAGATVHWAPLANDPEVEGTAGSTVPNMRGAVSEGSAIISSTEPVAGHLEIYLEDGSTSAYRLSGIAEATDSLAAVYFGTASFITVRNLADATNTIAIEYRDLAGVDRTPAQNTYELAAGATVRWAPLINDPGVEGGGSTVPGMTGDVAEGSAIISGTAPLAGQLEVAHGAGFSGYTLGYISGSTKSKLDFSLLVVPYFRTGSYIAIQNIAFSTATVAVQYYDLSGGTPLVSYHELPFGATTRWSPFVDEPGFPGTEGLAIITADGPLIGHLEQGDGGGPTSAYRLSGSDEWASSVVVPYFRLDSFISIINTGSQVTTLTVEYRDLAGLDRTPAQNTYELVPGATVRWAPLINDPGVEGGGSTVPDMTGNAAEGSAIINSVQLEPIAGQLDLGPGVAPSNEDINWDGRVDAVDIQLVINGALDLPVDYNCDVNGDGDISAIDIQLVINAALGLYTSQWWPLVPYQFPKRQLSNPL